MSDKLETSKDDQPTKPGDKMSVDPVLFADLKTQANRNDWVEQDYIAHEAYNQEAIDKVITATSHLVHLAAASSTALTNALNAANSLKSLIETEIARRG